MKPAKPKYNKGKVKRKAPTAEKPTTKRKAEVSQKGEQPQKKSDVTKRAKDNDVVKRAKELAAQIIQKEKDKQQNSKKAKKSKNDVSEKNAKSHKKKSIKTKTKKPSKPLSKQAIRKKRNDNKKDKKHTHLKHKVTHNKKTYLYVVKVLHKYYGFSKRKRFKNNVELRAKAHEVWDELQRQGLKATVKNIRLVLGRRYKPPEYVPELPPGWDEIRDYWELTEDHYYLDLIKETDERLFFVSENILGRNEKGEVIALQGGKSYSYYSTFQRYVDHLNKLNSDADTAERHSGTGNWMVRLRDIHFEKNTNRWEVILEGCNESGDRMHYGFLPTGVTPIEAEAWENKEKEIAGEHIAEIEAEVESETPEEPSVPSVGRSQTEIDAQIKIREIESAEKIKLAEIDLEKEKEKTKQLEVEKDKAAIELEITKLQARMKMIEAGYSKKEIEEILGSTKATSKLTVKKKTEKYPKAKSIKAKSGKKKTAKSIAKKKPK